MRNTLETRLGLFFALAFLAAIIVLELLGGPDFFKRGYHIRARFNNIQELKPGDAVKMGGVQIGRVEDVDFADGKILVTMKISNRKAAVKTDSVATIKFQGLLGQNYVEIAFGTPRGIKADTNTELRSVEQTDLSTLMAHIEQVATGVERVTTNFTADNFSNLLGPLTDFLKQNKDHLSGSISNIEAITGEIASGKGTVGRLIHEDALYNSALTTVTNFNDTAAEIKDTVADARKVIDQVRDGQGTVGKLIKEETLYREVTTAATNLREILEKINRGQGSVGKLVNDESLLKNVKLTLQKLDKATEGLEDQGPLTVLGVFAGKLF